MRERKIAIVYDWMDKMGGVERMLSTLAEMYPEAHWYTSYVDYKKAAWISKGVRTSFIQKLPSFIKSSRILSLPFYPYAFESFDFRSYDTVISVTSSFAKSVITQPHTKHVCILLTPTRWLWSHQNQYQITSILLRPLIQYFKKWDYVAAQRPDRIVSISKTVADRCRHYYHRESTVVYPPFDEEYWASIASKIKKSKILKQVQDDNTGFWTSQDDSERLLRFTRNDNEKYYLVVSRLEPYKKVDIAIKAFEAMPDNHLVIVGKGTQSSNLRSMAGKNVTFIQDATDTQLAHLYDNAQALIMPQEEDFGYVSLEAQYFGCPVISYNKGGARETIISGKTGTFFNKQSASAIRYAVAHFKRDKYNLEDRRKTLSQFSKNTFISTIRNVI